MVTVTHARIGEPAFGVAPGACGDLGDSADAHR